MAHGFGAASCLQQHGQIDPGRRRVRGGSYRTLVRAGTAAATTIEIAAATTAEAAAATEAATATITTAVTATATVVSTATGNETAAQARHAFDGATDTLVIGREVDVHAGLRHRHQGHPVAGAQAVDELGGGMHHVAPLPERDALLVDQDHDEPAGVGGCIGRVAGLRGGRNGRAGASLRRPQGDELRLDDGARLPVDRHREIGRPKVGNRVAVAVEDGGVHLDELDPAPEHGRLLRRDRPAQGDRGDRAHPECRTPPNGQAMPRSHANTVLLTRY